MIADAKYAAACWAASLRAALTYRGAFALQAIGMLVNNLLWLSFWGVFFARVREVRGWDFADTALLFAVSACGFGLVVCLGGGVLDLAGTIARGGLDPLLLRPRSALLQALVAKARLSGVGDVATALLLVSVLPGASASRFVAFGLASVAAGAAMGGFWLLVHSAGFWLGRGEAFAQQGVNTSLTIALYPPVVFEGGWRLALHVLVPAAFMGWIPAELVSSWSWPRAGLLLVGCTLVVAAGAAAWRAGLRRYESGNLTQAVDAG